MMVLFLWLAVDMIEEIISFAVYLILFLERSPVLILDHPPLSPSVNRNVFGGRRLAWADVHDLHQNLKQAAVCDSN